MRRGLWFFLALLVFLFALAASSSAVPLLVELKIRDALTSAAAPASGDEVLVIPSGSGKGKWKGGDSGNPDFSKLNLKSLTLWLSTDGKSWKALDGEITGLANDKINARFNAKGTGSPTDLAAKFGLPAIDTGQSPDSYYIGVSTGSTSFSGTTLSARLVSWNFVTVNTQSSAPEPAVWSLLLLGGLGAALALRSRRKA
jgi:hypothetical protein